MDAHLQLHRSGGPPDGAANVVVPLEKLDKEPDEWCQELMAKSPSCLKVLKSKREEGNGTEGDPGN